MFGIGATKVVSGAPVVSGAAVVGTAGGIKVVPAAALAPVQIVPSNPYHPDKVMFKVLSAKNITTSRMKTASTWQASEAQASPGLAASHAVA